MKIQNHITLEDYIARGDKNTAGLLKTDHPLMPLARAYYRFFADQLWADSPPVPTQQVFLSANAFTIWTAALRMALTGHEAATYPLLRTALESACYALIIARRPEMAAVWSARHDGDEQRKACRKAFGSAVADAATATGGIHPGAGTFLMELYESFIDLGAHPNTRAVMNHVHQEDEAADQVRFGLGSIYPGNSYQVARTILAVVETGRGLSMVLTAALPEISSDVVAAVEALETEHATLFDH